MFLKSNITFWRPLHLYSWTLELRIPDLCQLLCWLGMPGFPKTNQDCKMSEANIISCFFLDNEVKDQFQWPFCFHVYMFFTTYRRCMVAINTTTVYNLNFMLLMVIMCLMMKYLWWMWHMAYGYFVICNSTLILSLHCNRHCQINCTPLMQQTDLWDCPQHCWCCQLCYHHLLLCLSLGPPSLIIFGCAPSLVETILGNGRRTGTRFENR